MNDADKTRVQKAPVFAEGSSDLFLEKLLAFVELTRINRPIGIFLLLWPTLWALWVAADGKPDEVLLIVFVVGTILTRSAGCIINDIADRHFDGKVKRTRDRPLASGKLSVREALMLFVALGVICLLLLVFLNPLARWLALVGIALIFLYPYTKRFFSAPQLILGAAFAWGVPMAFAAQTNELVRETWLLFLVAIVWAVIYDTMYAMTDKDDDVKLGVKSTAILFGDADRYILAMLQLLMLFGLALVGASADLGGWYYSALIVSAIFMVYQQYLIRHRQRLPSFAAFLNNHYIGMTVFVGIALSYLFRTPV